MKILITGGSGVIGYYLSNFLRNQHNIEFTYFSNNPLQSNGYYLDLTQKHSTLELINKINPDCVIHAAALTNVDLCETDKNLATSINIDSTKNVITGCQNIDSKLLLISTSFVFDGTKKQYFEDDEYSPINHYGTTKAESERLVMSSDLDYLILRTDQPFCWIKPWQHTNSVLRVIQTLKSKKILREPTDWYNNPTYVPNFVHSTAQLISQKKSGIFHIVSSSFLNRYEWSLKTADIFGLDRNQIESMTSDMLKLPAKRPNVNLSNEKLNQTIGIKIKSINEELYQMLEDKRTYENN